MRAEVVVVAAAPTTITTTTTTTPPPPAPTPPQTPLAGPAFIGAELGHRFGFGLFAIEYPGYGVCALEDGQTKNQETGPSEAAVFEAAEALLTHFEAGKVGRQTQRAGEDDGEGEGEGEGEGKVAPQVGGGQGHDRPRRGGGATILVGQSIGCAVAVEMARRGFGERMVLISPFTCIADMASALFPFLKPALQVAPWLVRDKLDNAARVPELRRDLPVLILHGDQDEVVPVAQGRALAKLLEDTRASEGKGMEKGKGKVSHKGAREVCAEFACGGWWHWRCGDPVTGDGGRHGRGAWRCKHDHTTIRPHDHTTIRPYDHTTTRPHDHTTTRPYDHTTTRPYDRTTIRPLTGTLHGTPQGADVAGVADSKYMEIPGAGHNNLFDNGARMEHMMEVLGHFCAAGVLSK